MSTSTILDVQGMTCPSCVRHVNHALIAVEGVSAVEVVLRDGVVVVQHDGAALDDLVEALRDAGYESCPRGR